MILQVELPDYKFRVGDIIKLNNSNNSESIVGYIYNICGLEYVSSRLVYNDGKFVFTGEHPYIYHIILQEGSYYDTKDCVKCVPGDLLYLTGSYVDDIKIVNNFSGELVKYPNSYYVHGVGSGVLKITDPEDIREYFDNVYYLKLVSKGGISNE